MFSIGSGVLSTSLLNGAAWVSFEGVGGQESLCFCLPPSGRQSPHLVLLDLLDFALCVASLVALFGWHWTPIITRRLLFAPYPAFSRFRSAYAVLGVLG
jgi:hypothetical protein